MLKIEKLQASLLSGDKILKGLSLKVKPGELHAVMGPNGSGKSTLAYVLAGHPHYEVTGGGVSLDEKDILSETPDQRAKAGLFLAFQYPVAISGVSVQNFLRAAYEQRFPEAKKKAGYSVLKFRQQLSREAEKLGISQDFLKRSVNEGFSGGEKKRLEILQMIVLKPKYAILDETDSGLDIDSIKLVAEGVKRTIKEEKTGAILITHYQRILDYLEPDFVHVMVKGKIVESGNKNLVKSLEKKGYRQFSPAVGV